MSTFSANEDDRVGRLAEEFVARYRRGERPSLEEYTSEYPELTDEIRERFPELPRTEGVQPGSDQATGTYHAGAVRDDATSLILSQLGDFRLLRELGRGGMGVVYEAEQVSLDRRVALKVLPPHALRDPKLVHRFRREAQAAARLHHTNIVPVYGVGEESGTHYYVMQYIQGQPLSEVLNELRRLRDSAGGSPATVVHPTSDRPAAAEVAQSLWAGRSAATLAPEDGASGAPGSGASVTDPLPPGAARESATVAASPLVARPAPRGEGLGSSSGSGPLTQSSGARHAARQYARDVARIGVQVAEALDYAAAQGVLHRDVKPSNILLDAQGTAWVTDFGLAKVAGQDDLTGTGDVVGTLRYMAPERFRGQADARSDVYALGLTLYELLALRPAFVASDRASLIERITASESPRLETLAPEVPRDLATVVHKAISREPSERYATAGALAADLNRFLEDRPIAARRPRRRELAWRWCRRNPAVASLLGLVALLLVAGTAISTVAAWRYLRLAAAERAARHEADRRASEAKAVMSFLVNDMLASATPERSMGREVPVREVVAAADAAIGNRFADQPLVEAAVRQVLGTTYRGLGAFDKARAHLERALSLREQHLGSRDRETLTTMGDLGQVLRYQGNMYEGDVAERKRVRAFLERALELQRRALGEDDPLTLTTMHDLADELHDLASSQNQPLHEAMALHERVLEARRRVLGPEHPETLQSMNDLADVERDWGARDGDPVRLGRARALYQQVLELDCRVLGPDHPKTLTVMNDYATLLYRLGTADERRRAESLFRESLERNQRVRPNHPATWRTMADLGVLLSAQGRSEPARALLAGAMDGLRSSLRPGHPLMLTLLYRLAMDYRDRGELDKAEPLLVQALAGFRRTRGPEHREALIVTNDLAMLYDRLGRYGKAEPLLREVLKDRRRALPPGHPELAAALVMLGKALLGAGRAQEAEPPLREALEIRRKALPKGHWLTANTESLLGGCLSAQGRYAEAEPLLLGSYPAFASTQGVPPQRAREALDRIVALYQAWGKPEKAAQWRAQRPSSAGK